MKCALVGSRYFAATVFEALRKEDGIEFTSIVAPAADDRLALAARAAGLPVHVLDNPQDRARRSHCRRHRPDRRRAHHARVSNEALARSRLGGVGYHPSLLPRHRGIAAVEWTILEGDPIAGGSVYHLADGWDAGAIAAQDWCFVRQGRNRARTVGTCAGADGPGACWRAWCAMPASTASCRRTRRTSVSPHARR